MTIANKGTLGTSVNTGNNQANFSHATATTTLSPGNLGVIIIATENNQTTDGDEACVSNVQDSAGNTWLKAAEFTNGQGSAQAGALVSVWYTVAVNSLAPAGTITGDFTNSGSHDESAFSAWAFTCSGAVSIPETPATQPSDGVDVGSLDVTTANKARLRIRAISEEANDATQMTATDGTWTLFGNARSAAIANAQCVRGEWKISTGTSDASNPTLATTTGDSASVYIAFSDITDHVGLGDFDGVGSVSSYTRQNHIVRNVPPNYVALLHFDGAFHSQIFPDEAGHTWTAVVGARLTTTSANIKFGTAALEVGSNDYIYGDGSSDFAFGTGDFTIDFWTRPFINNSSRYIYDSRPFATNGFYPTIRVDTDNTVRFFTNSADQITGTTALVADTYYHIAVTRSGGSTRLFINGTQEGSTYADTNDYLNGATQRPVLAVNGNTLSTSFPLNHWVDELRVLKGVAAWTTTFTPPTAEYVVDGFRFGGAGNVSADATVVTAGGTAHVGEARFAGGRRLDVADNFNRAGPGLGSNWTTASGGTPEIVSSTVMGAASTGQHCIVQWNADQFDPDQFSECTIAALNNGDGTALATLSVRHQASNPFNFYVAVFETVAVTFYIDAGVPIGTGALASFAPGDVIRVEVIGDTLVAKKNGVTVLTRTDTTYTRGSPGVGVFRTAGTAVAQIDNWSAGSAAAPSSVQANLLMPAAMTLGGAGSLSLNTTLQTAARATFGGTGNLSADIIQVTGGQAQVGEARWAGSGALSVNVTARLQARSTFAGAGNFSANAVQAGTQAGEARFAGAGSLSVNVRQIHASQAIFAGSGALTANWTSAQRIGAIFNGAGNLSLHGMQIAPLIPDGDSSTGGWLTEVDSLPLFPSIDEIVPLDADYIKSSAAPTVDTCKISLSNPMTSALVAPVSVLYRYGKSGTDTAQLQVRLLQGTTMIAVWQHDDIAAGFVTVEQFLTDPMIGNITDWNDLFLEFRSGTITAHMGRETLGGGEGGTTQVILREAAQSRPSGIGSMSVDATSTGDTTAPSVPGGVTVEETF